MNIADLLLALKRGDDPNAAILAAAQAPAPGGGAFPAVQPPGDDAALLPAPAPASAVPSVPIPPPRPATAPPPPPATAPTGVPTPITNPMSPEQAPRMIQSPPDLSNMYLELIKKNQNAQALDSGMSMIAAGFSKYPENRAALLRGAFDRSGAQNLTSDDIVKLQGLQVKNQALQIRQAAKAGLMKQYGLSRDTIDYLDASDKLDEVIKHKNTGTLVSIKDSETGQMSLWDNATGKKITDVGGPEKPVGTPIKTEEGPTRLIDPKTGQQIGPDIGGGKATRGVLATDPATGQQIMVDPETGKPIGEPIGAPKAPANEADRAALADINKDRPADKQMTMEQYLTRVKRQGVTVNVGPQGQQFPPPKQGWDYRRNEDGTVYVNPDTRQPEQYPIPGGTGADEATKIGAEAKKLTREEQEAVEKKNKIKWNEIRAASTVMNSVDRALELAPQIGATGVLAPASRSLFGWIGGKPSDSYDAQIGSIDANTAFQELQRMREASPTGGAIGNVTDFEQKMLAGSIADLRARQQTRDAEKALIRVKAMFKTLVENRFDDKVDKDSPAKFEALLNKNIQDFTVENANKNKSGSRTFQNIKRIE